MAAPVLKRAFSIVWGDTLNRIIAIAALVAFLFIGYTIYKNRRNKKAFTATREYLGELSHNMFTREKDLMARAGITSQARLAELIDIASEVGHAFGSHKLVGMFNTGTIPLIGDYLNDDARAIKALNRIRSAKEYLVVATVYARDIRNCPAGKKCGLYCDINKMLSRKEVKQLPYFQEWGVLTGFNSTDLCKREGYHGW